VALHQRRKSRIGAAYGVSAQQFTVIHWLHSDDKCAPPQESQQIYLAFSMMSILTGAVPGTRLNPSRSVASLERCGGLGRTGTMLAADLISQGKPMNQQFAKCAPQKARGSKFPLKFNSWNNLRLPAGPAPDAVMA
jgi:hypothetical protein